MIHKFSLPPLLASHLQAGGYKLSKDQVQRLRSLLTALDESYPGLWSSEQIESEHSLWTSEYAQYFIGTENCGHNPGLHYSSTGTKLLEGGGPSLNLLKDAEFKTLKLTLGKNDQILFYTDGVVEVFNKDKKQFGLDRLINVFNSNADKSPDDIIKQIISATKDFSSSDFYNDDFTLLVLKKNN